MNTRKTFACIFLALCSGTVIYAARTDMPQESQMPSASYARQNGPTLTGIVTDSHGEPLPGVSVSIEGTVTGTITDIDGRYQLKIGKEQHNATLVFSFIGMQTQHIAYKGQHQLNVTLRDDHVALEDVVVIGYGSKNRKSLTSSISSVKKEDIERMAPVSHNIQDLLGGGMVKGVLATQNSGEPGASITINVRGVTAPYPNMQTGTNNNAPLYVIDGVPLFAESTSINPLQNLSPNDIESIDVLKDASATAIYGSRGANGVIIVTTKDGRKESKPSVEVGYTLSIVNPTKMFDTMSNEAFLKYTDENLRNAVDAWNQGIGYSAAIDALANVSYAEDGSYIYHGLNQAMFGTANTNWTDEVMNRNALTHQYTASIRGGSAKTNYSLSLNGQNEQGLYRNDNLETYGGRLALNTDLNNHIRIGGVMNYSETNRRSTSDGLGTASSDTKPWLVRPDITVYDEDGNYTRIDTGLEMYGMAGLQLEPNPVALTQRRTTYSSNQFLGNLFAEIDLMKGLKFRTDFSMTNYTFESEYFTPKVASIDMSNLGLPLESTLLTSDSKYTTMSLNFRLDYSLNIRKHLFGAMLGYGSERSKAHSRSFTFQGFPDDENLNNIGSAQTLYGKSETSSKNGLNSVYGRVNYDYDGRYLVELSMRADASSKFGPENQWGFFPALSAGWIISEEDFIKNKKQINNLKFRLSLGQTGSTNVADFVYKQYYTYGDYPYGNGSTIVLNGTLPNRNIGWEKTSEVNVGLDFGLFDNRLYGSLDWYYRYTDGALAPAPHIWEAGMNTYYDNIIDMSNRGFELSLGADIVRTNNFNWSSILNLSLNRNRVEELNNAQIDTYMQDYFVVGKPVGVVQGYIVDHIVQDQSELDRLNAQAAARYGEGTVYQATTGVGDYLLKDLDGDGVFSTTGDKTVIANPEPNFFGGWNNTFSYKNWSLSILMQFSQGGEALYNDLAADMIGIAGKGINPELYDNFWTPDRRDAKYARIGDGIYNYNTSLLDRYVFSTSYLRMKNITLSYNLPKPWLSKLHIAGASVYAVATNLFTVSGWPGLDPESVGSGTTLMGTNYDSYPLSKTFSIGVKLQF